MEGRKARLLGTLNPMVECCWSKLPWNCGFRAAIRGG